jgi:hypothetical protein
VSPLKNKPRPSRKHERRIRISVVLPTSVELVVGTDEDDPDESSDWEILEARDPRCEVSPRIVEESMHVDDFAGLARDAARAPNAEDES